ncbi:hypothetical protein AVEN_112873-1 [Araneus ventricosus]|uniref:Uncharacterized protein n=1 Tax=Araneus ventricosus TaxID=182803 RepID=A0A4Y2F7U1_ARAVE|nr:hypothetical protein AVEN_112873-1 [Araneus ventricosus]
MEEKNFLMKQFNEYGKILDDASRSLAAAIGKRRDLISASSEFHRLLFEFRKKVKEVKDFVTLFDNSHDHQAEMKIYIQKIQVFIDDLCYISALVLSQGLNLLQVLTKLKLSDTTREKHRHHVGGWLAFVEVEREFRLMELNRLSMKLHLMWQLQRCNLGIRQAIHWLKDLIQSMLARSEEIGETAVEADDLFLQHIRFQEAGKKSHQIGVQLTEIADGLRKRLEMSKDWSSSSGNSLHVQLEETSREFWKIFRGIAQRLDMCQSFYRNTKKLLRRLEELVKCIQSKLKVFGEIRRDFVIQIFRKTWVKIYFTHQKCQEIGSRLLVSLTEPLTDHHRVNLLSSSAAIQIERTMSHTDKTVQQVQSTYFNEEAPSATESASEYVSARSPETWRSTSISGVEDWCSIGSEGTTLDDFKSLDDDLAEEYCSDDNVEELPFNDQPGVAETATSTARRGSGTKEHTAVSGVQDNKSKKFTSHIQPAAGREKVDAQSGAQAKPSSAFHSGAPKAGLSVEKAPKESSGKDSIVAVSPKSSVCFEPPKYSTIISKTETEDVKTEVKKSYEIKTQIKSGGASETFTSYKSEDIQSGQPDSKAEKVHKIEITDDTQRAFPKVSVTDDFPKGSAFGSSKAELFSELEGLKTKCFKEPSESASSSGIKTENVSYGFSSFSGGQPSSAEGGRTKTDVSKVLYSKEVTESHSFTSISFQQQSLGATRSEKWQSVTPQVKEPLKSIEAPPEMDVISQKLKKLEEEIKTVCCIFFTF